MQPTCTGPYEETVNPYVLPRHHWSVNAIFALYDHFSEFQFHYPVFSRFFDAFAFVLLL
jgi:hypothetical protein